MHTVVVSIITFISSALFAIKKLRYSEHAQETKKAPKSIALAAAILSVDEWMLKPTYKKLEDPVKDIGDMQVFIPRGETRPPEEEPVRPVLPPKRILGLSGRLQQADAPSPPSINEEAPAERQKQLQDTRESRPTAWNEPAVEKAKQVEPTAAESFAAAEKELSALMPGWLSVWNPQSNEELSEAIRKATALAPHVESMLGRTIKAAKAVLKERRDEATTTQKEARLAKRSKEVELELSTAMPGWLAKFRGEWSERATQKLEAAVKKAKKFDPPPDSPAARLLAEANDILLEKKGGVAWEAKQQGLALESELRDAMPGWFGAWNAQSTAKLATAIAKASAIPIKRDSPLIELIVEAKAELRKRAEEDAKMDTEAKKKLDQEEPVSGQIALDAAIAEAFATGAEDGHVPANGQPALSVDFRFEGNVDDFDAASERAFQQKLSTVFNVKHYEIDIDIDLKVSSGSVIVAATIKMADRAALASSAAKFEKIPMEELSSFLGVSLISVTQPKFVAAVPGGECARYAGRSSLRQARRAIRAGGALNLLRTEVSPKRRTPPTTTNTSAKPRAAAADALPAAVPLPPPLYNPLSQAHWPAPLRPPSRAQQSHPARVTTRPAPFQPPTLTPPSFEQKHASPARPSRLPLHLPAGSPSPPVVRAASWHPPTRTKPYVEPRHGVAKLSSQQKQKLAVERIAARAAEAKQAEEQRREEAEEDLKFLLPVAYADSDLSLDQFEKVVNTAKNFAPPMDSSLGVLLLQAQELLTFKRKRLVNPESTSKKDDSRAVAMQKAEDDLLASMPTPEQLDSTLLPGWMGGWGEHQNQKLAKAISWATSLAPSSTSSLGALIGEAKKALETKRSSRLDAQSSTTAGRALPAVPELAIGFTKKPDGGVAAGACGRGGSARVARASQLSTRSMQLSTRSTQLSTARSTASCGSSGMRTARESKLSFERAKASRGHPSRRTTTVAGGVSVAAGGGILLAHDEGSVRVLVPRGTKSRAQQDAEKTQVL